MVHGAYLSITDHIQFLSLVELAVLVLKRRFIVPIVLT